MAGDTSGAVQEIELTEHPLLPALVEETDIMRRRLRLRWRNYRPLESHWLVASTDTEWDDGSGPAGMYVNLATGARSASFPAEALATPLTEVKRLTSSVERDVEPHEKRKRITLTRGQSLVCAHFAQIVDTAWREERRC